MNSFIYCLKIAGISSFLLIYPVWADSSKHSALQTDAEKLEFLMALHERLPSLFGDAIQFQVDLFQLLEEARSLTNLLSKEPSYLRALEQLPPVSMVISPPSTGIPVDSLELDPDAIFAWKSDLLAKLDSTEGPASFPQSLRSQIRVRLQELEKRYAAGEQQYPLTHELIDHLGSLLFLQIFTDLGGATSWSELRSVLSVGITVASAAVIFDQEDFLAPRLIELLQAAQSPAPLAHDIMNHLFSRVGFYSSRTRALSTRAKDPVKITQVPHEVGIFRGSAGGNAAVQSYFPWPNDPNERVFFIEDSKKVKGYVSATRVTHQGSPALYVHTISGPHVTEGDTALILRGLEKEKAQLGVDAILLPRFFRAAKLIRFRRIRGVFWDRTQRQAGVEFEFRPDGTNDDRNDDRNDKRIRDTIVNFRSKFNVKRFSGQDHRGVASVLRFDDQYSSVIDTQVDFQRGSWVFDLPKSRGLSELSREFLVKFFLDLHRLDKKSTLINRMLKIPEIRAKINSSDIRSLFKVMQTCDSFGGKSLTVRALESRVNQRLEKLGLAPSFLEEIRYFLYPAITQCADSFSAEEIENTARFILSDMNRNKNRVPIEIEKDLFDGALPRLQRTEVFKESSRRLVRQLRAGLPHFDFVDAMALYKLGGWSLPEARLIASRGLQDRDPVSRRVVVSSVINTLLRDLDIRLDHGADTRERVLEIKAQLLSKINTDLHAALVSALVSDLEDSDSENREYAALLLRYLSDEPVSAENTQLASQKPKLSTWRRLLGGWIDPVKRSL